MTWRRSWRLGQFSRPARGRPFCLWRAGVTRLGRRGRQAERIVAVDAGLPCGEVIELQWANVDPQKRLLVVRSTKGRVDRQMPMTDLVHGIFPALREANAGGGGVERHL